ncbi:hypothetical protein C479_06557 [Halovivax asiaticus JCM 14624]|uniref:Cobalamin cluster protein n=1 Tax=Halovivax asiaticus JCM 14624 TaxID=1227490 RepID=M0BLF6_9EURY|nr:CbtA family protein [Halovivax asiaticus]ELZ11695.1 hypothetical protein C479_06557 [Halovivax asiaticus JCM 14624]
MLADYLKRGVAAGLVAGVAYGLYIVLVASPLLGAVHGLGGGHDSDHAHGGEAGHGHAHEAGGAHGHEHAEAVSETTAAIVSAGSGVLWAILLAGTFAIAYYLFEPALPGDVVGKALTLAAAGFFSVSLLPWLVLPPMVPGAEASLGIDARLATYAGLVAAGALASGLSLAGYRRLAAGGRYRAIALASLPIAVVVIAAATLAPSIVTQPAIAGDLVTAVQGATVLSQAALWACLAGCFAWFHRRAGNAGTDRLETDAASLPTA